MDDTRKSGFHIWEAFQAICPVPEYFWVGAFPKLKAGRAEEFQIDYHLLLPEACFLYKDTGHQAEITSIHIGQVVYRVVLKMIAHLINRFHH